MVMPALVPRYTAEEVRGFPDDRVRYEVIRGELFVTPAPGTAHQRGLLELAVLLKAYVESHGLGEVLVAPFEVEFAEDTAVQPDILVIGSDRAHGLTTERFHGAPTITVEVVSYSSRRTDRLQKRALYLEEGVDEYWVVDPGERRVERYVSGAASPELLTNVLTWAPRSGLPPFEVDLGALFRRIHR
jgi:Uma2 family endonuclease